MAKSTEKKPTENFLEEAVLPAEKAPYALPPNWCWVKLNALGDFGMGQTILSKELREQGIPIYSATADDKVFGFINLNENKINLTYGDFVIAARGTIGSVKMILDKNACCTQTTIYMKPYNKQIPKYLFHVMRGFSDKLFIPSGATIPQLTISSLSDKFVPFAPLEEQKRIVDRIENLFVKLDEARELIQKSLDFFEDRKTMILHKAFTGELTSGGQNAQSVTHWRKYVLGDVASYKKGPFGSSITKAMFVEKGENTFKVYEQGNAIRKTINYGKYYISQKKFDELKTFEVEGGDIIVSCAGTIGETYMLPEDCEKGIINQALMRVRLNDNINCKFFLYYFGEVLRNELNDKAKGIAIKNIPRFSVLKQIPILLPTMQEQEEIVKILDSFFEKEDKTKELLDMLDKIDELKKCILARAFRGELGTNNPDDEPATEFLKRITEEKQI